MRKLFSMALSMLLVACGGGGGSGGSGGTPATGFASLPAVSTLAQSCAAPRSGTDPYTKKAYTDRQGSLLDEQNWLAAWTNDLYLWYSEVPYPAPSSYASIATYFDALKTPLLSPSGAAKDKFHFTYKTSDWEALSSGGAQPGYGFTVTRLSPPRTLPRNVVVVYTDPNTPAANVSPVLRGSRILSVDGVDLLYTNTQTGVDALNAGMSPATAGESHTLVVQDASGTTRSITLVSANVASVPVQNVSTLVSGAVGYMLFNDHLATAEPALIAAVAQLKTAAVTDLVLDIRYNGGGYLDIASELAYMIAGPTKTSGKTFELMTFNAKHPTIDPVTGATIIPTPFWSTALGSNRIRGSSTPTGTVLPHLDLTRVYVLTGPDTCSASESVMNSLRGAGVQVIQIGSTTCGKPYGFYPQDNCGTTYFSIEFKGVNAAGFGDYSDGFAPANSTAAASLTANAVFPGCSVGDDFNHALGDPAEARLAAALQYRSSGICPAATGLGAPRLLKASAAASDGVVYKTPFLLNRILLH